MGVLDEAIREHIELKRRNGADPSEVARLEKEAFGPITRGELATPPAPPAADAGHHADLAEPAAGDAAHGHAASDDGFEDQPTTHGAPHLGLGIGTDDAGAVHEDPFGVPADDPAAAPHDPAPAAPEARSPYQPPLDEPADARPSLLEDPVAGEPPVAPGDRPAAPGDALADTGRAPEPAREAWAEDTWHAPPPAADQPTQSYSLEDLEALRREEEAATPGVEGPDPDVVPADAEPQDELEGTPDFLEETPEHERLWFEQKPPKDFDF